MLPELEDYPVVGPLPLKHGARIVQAMGEYVDLTIGGRNELAVEPDEVGTLVEWHSHGIASLWHGRPYPTEILGAIRGLALRSMRRS